MSKLGAHIVSGSRNGYGPMCQAKPAVVLAHGEGGALVEAKQKSGGHTYTIFRHTLYKDAPQGIDQWTPTQAIAAAATYYPQLKAQWAMNPADYYLVVNEPAGNDVAIMPTYIAYEQRVMELAAADGYKICALNLAGGTPGDLNVWKSMYVPHIKKVFEAGGVYGRHAYGGEKLSVPNGNTNRPFLEAEHLRSVGLGYGGIVITEAGQNGGFGFIGTEAFMADTTAYNTQMMAHPNIIGACLWTLGDWEQHNSNWQDATPAMTNWMLANPTPKWIPGTPPPPPSLPKIVVVKKPQGTEITAAENAAANQYAWDNYGRTTTHSTDDMMRLLTGGNSESYAVLAYPDRPSQTEAMDALLAAGIDWVNWPPAGPQIKVIPLSQRDARWASIPMGGGKTIGGWGCLLVAYNVMANYWKLCNETPDVFLTRMQAAGAMTGPYMNPAALRTAFPTQVAYDGYVERGPTLNGKIKEWIGKGIPVPARVDFNPTTGQWEQHWILIVGYEGDEFWMMDPWHGDVQKVSLRYGIAGDDLLEGIFYHLATTPVAIDMTPYFLPTTGNFGQILILKNSWGGGDERCQLQRDGSISYLTKNSQYEKRTIAPTAITLNLDTSPGNGEYYTSTGTWLPAAMTVGQVFSRTQTISFYWKKDCKPSKPAYTSTSSIKLVARHATWTCPESLIKLSDVIELQWLVNGVVDETYWFARGLGLVRWLKYTGQKSWIHELVPVGSQGNNVRETGCFT